MLAPPAISVPDPLLGQEGSVDPLSLQRTYERLADRIFPAITVRMSRIRFLSAMCVGARVCADYPPDTVAADGVTPAWLVHEWFVIEALARSDQEVAQQSIAGLRKVRQCLDGQRPVSAATYLKTPKVFGFNGIFRRLAVGARLLFDDMQLDDGGYELLHAVEREEDLPGLVDGANGAGAELIRELRSAVDRGLEKAHTVHVPKPFWERVAAHMIPTHVKRREAKVLLERLRATSALTGEVIDDLAGRGQRVTRGDEADYVRDLARRASAALATLLTAIDAYESLCRPVTDAFVLIRHLSTRARGAAVGPAEFAAHPSAGALAAATRTGCDRVASDRALLELEPDVRKLLDGFDAVSTPHQLFGAIVGHHEQAQRDKPPDGKRPWIEPGSSGAVAVRPAYQVDELGDDRPPYVHDYRVATLCRFLTDLGVLS